MTDESDAQLTFTVKSSQDAKYAITIAASATVADLKAKLAAPEQADLPVERQRLIYSGRVLKDPDALHTYKIKDGHTIHLVKAAESNQRQNPANQGGAAAAVPGAANVPTSIATGTGAHNPLAQMTGARYAGYHQLPGAEMFGADGGMGAPPDPDQMLRMLENPNFVQQINEAMNNPDVINMMRNNPMLRNNPMAQALFENPEMRRMLMNPDFIRMQMNMQRAMGGGGNSAFPAPGATDTTPQIEGQQNNNSARQQQQIQANPFAAFGGGAGLGGPSGANPFAALFGGNPGAVQGHTPAVTPPVGSTGQATPAESQTPGSTTGAQNQLNPFANLFGGAGGLGGAGAGTGAGTGAGRGAGRGAGGGSDAFAEMTRRMMQDPEAMRNAMNMLGMGDLAGAGGAAGLGDFGGAGGLGGFGGTGGLGGGAAQQPADNVPPEERYSEQLQQLNAMGFYEFDRNVRALRMSGGIVEGAVELLLSGAI
ncbi:hypothetical protein MBLNU459_g2335t1 [Dothideomycetes sp. NU459]